jgi:N-methylhydantoinase A/oxoprolinase/acetone carboxylase beta subunit
LGCDIGGTFTDFFLFRESTGEVWVEKHPTTADDPSIGVILGLKKFEEKVGNYLPMVKNFIHGTTLVINAVIERKGATTGLVTTHGFRDILEMRTESRYDIYDLFQQVPRPLVPRYLRKGVNERTHASGSIIRRVNKSELCSALDEMIAEQIESIAVCLLHSYANPHNEEIIGEIISQRYPELSVSLSSEVCPEIREYERTVTTVVNAYTKPITKRYLDDLLERTGSLGYKGQINVMLSGGGITTSKGAKEFPVRVIDSGPAGGAVACEYYSKTINEPNMLGLDMGGTTAKICLIRNGKADKKSEIEISRSNRFKKGSGIPLKVPFIDIAEIGAGGGSIAWINKLGLLQVGPESAGAKPGPACYGLGGNKGTVTDADLLLGYLNKDYFLGGEMRLFPDKAKHEIVNIAKKIGITYQEASRGIFEIVNENMANTARLHVLERGYDPSKFTMIAYGGAGPVHAYAIAKKLKINKFLVPVNAGVLPALGFLEAPFSFDFSRTYKRNLSKTNFSEIKNIFNAMMNQAYQILPARDKRKVQFNHSVDMCYVGQQLEINISVEENTANSLNRDNLTNLFNESYRTLYGGVYADTEISLVNLRLKAIVPVKKIDLSKKKKSEELVEEAIKEQRKAFCIDKEEWVDFTVYDRSRLFGGASFSGPAIVEERESTTVVGSAGSVYVDAYEILHIVLEGAK